MLLAGSFTEYPFFLLLEIFLRRHETGLLEVSSPRESGYFYVKNGEIKDGEVGKARGAAAVKLAGSLVDGSFQFKPLESAEYARIVWAKSFGPNKRVADRPHFRVEALRTTVEQFRPYSEAAYVKLEGTVVSFAQRVLRQLLFYMPAAYHSLEKTGVSLMRLTLAYATSAYEISKRAQVRKKLMPALRKALTASQIALRGIEGVLHKYARVRKQSLQLRMILKRAAIFQSLPQGVQNNISFAVIVVALGVVTAVTISQILQTNQNHADTVTAPDEDVSTQPRPRHVSGPRAKRKSRIGKEKETFTVDKTRGVSLAQEPKVPLPQATSEAAAVNAESDSDIPKKQPSTTSDGQSISVVLQIENGRVSRASLLNHRPGLEGYEAAALRIARQRRYATAGKHTDTLVVKVPPKP